MRRKAYRTIKLGPQDHLQLKISRSGDELHLQTSYCVEIWDKKASSGAEQRHFKEHIPTYYDTQNQPQAQSLTVIRQSSPAMQPVNLTTRKKKTKEDDTQGRMAQN